MTPTARPAWWRLRRRLADAPPVLPALGIGIVSALLPTSARLASGQAAPGVDRLLATATVGALVTAVAAVVLARRRRRPAGAVRAVEVSEAVDDGELPAGADPAAWSALLLRRRELHDQLGGPAALLVAGALLAGTLLLAALGGPPFAGTLPAVIASVVAGLAIVRRRRVAEIDVLLQPLLSAAEEERDDPAHAADGPDAR